MSKLWEGSDHPGHTEKGLSVPVFEFDTHYRFFFMLHLLISLEVCFFFLSFLFFSFFFANIISDKIISCIVKLEKIRYVKISQAKIVW